MRNREPCRKLTSPKFQRRAGLAVESYLGCFSATNGRLWEGIPKGVTVPNRRAEIITHERSSAKTGCTSTEVSL